MLAVFRFILGLGMGGEWNTGATLVAETWPTELRAKAISVVQSSWAIGYALAALVAGIVLHYADWRMAFFVGILPALVVLWIRRGVPESEMWQERHRASREFVGEEPVGDEIKTDVASYVSTAGGSEFIRIFRPPYTKHTFALLLMNFFGMFAWWGLFTWIPPYLSLPVEQGGRGFGVMGTTTLLVVLNLAGMFPGYASFGWVADAIGRRRSFILYTLIAAFLVPLYASRQRTVDPHGSGGSAGIFRDGIFLGLGNYWKRNLPDRGSGTSSGLYLQRRADDEFDRSLCDRARGADKRAELGFLFVWRGRFCWRARWPHSCPRRRGSSWSSQWPVVGGQLSASTTKFHC